MAGLLPTGAVVASAATPVLARQVFDGGNQKLTRPSVLLGLGLGGSLVASSYLIDKGTIDSPVGSNHQFTQTAMPAGAAMMGAGLASALVPSNPGTVINLPV